MFNSRNSVLSAVFQSRGYAFRIIGSVSGCPDVDDVGRQFIAEAIQLLTLTAVKKLHAEPRLALDIIDTAAGDFTPDFRIVAVRHVTWRKLNRVRTKVDRLFDREMTRWAI